jgi:hypothetical protein
MMGQAYNVNVRNENVKVCDDGTLMHNIMFLNIIHPPVLILNIILFLLKKTQGFGDWIFSVSSGKTLIDRARHCLRRLRPTE